MRVPFFLTFFVVSLLLNGIPSVFAQSIVLSSSKTETQPDTGQGGCMQVIPESQEFCSGRVYPNGVSGHITWKAYATQKNIKVVKAYYLKRCSKVSREETEAQIIWRTPPHKPQQVLTLSPSTKEGVWKNCVIPEKTNTVIEISQFFH